MVIIRNTQRIHKINIKNLKKKVLAILQLLDYKGFDMGIWLTTNKTIRRYNKLYRSKDRATDILSFPTYPDLKPGNRIVANNRDEKSLGDLIISLEYVIKDAPQWNQSFKERITILLIHGICHLLGYDHEYDNDYIIMAQEEKRILEFLNHDQ